MAVVGIDLGTTNTVVASVRGGRVQTLPDEQGRRLLPSVVSFHPSGEILVGHPAKERRSVDAKNTVASVKRLIGRAWNSEELKRSRQRFAFELKEGPGQGALVVARGQEYTLPEISAFVLRRAREIAEQALGEVVDRAVITVPANFNELQRAATKVAGRVAGLDVLRIINEPTAAALAYGMGRSPRRAAAEGGDPTKERIAVYDFGGGTFDCTLLDLSGNVFEVLATAGDSFLGGDDIDVAIAERMAASFLRQHRYDPLADKQVFERLRAAAEVIKIELSTKDRATTTIKEVAFGSGGASLDLDFTMSRGELEVLMAPLVERTFAVCQDALHVARLERGAFDKVILVGGSSRVPIARQRVEQFFGMVPLDRVNPEEVVAIGAAIQAAALTEVARRRSIPPAPHPSRPSYPPRDEVTRTSVMTALIAEGEKSRPPPLPPPRASVPTSPPPTGHVVSHTLRMGVVEPTMPSAPQAPPPAAATPPPPPPPPVRPFTRTQPMSPAVVPPAAPSLPSTAVIEPLSSEPLIEETPALPPAVPEARPGLPAPRLDKTETPTARPIAGPPPVLVDVTPRALIVETAGGWSDVVVQRNAKIPCERTRAFTTSSDLQTVVRVRVAQGENPTFEGNTFLGELELSGLRAAPRGEVTIEVRFEVDESGTLRVLAKDLATGKEERATLQLVGVAPGQDVQAMQARQATARVTG
jgi:molecular chaperone DnaK